MKSRGISFWGLLSAAAAVAIFASVLGFMGSWFWFFDLFSHFRVQYALGFAFLALIYGAGRYRRPALACLLLAAINAAVVIPLYLGEVAPVPAGTPVRLMLFNVNTHFGNPDQVSRLLKDVQPGILVLEEVDRGWVIALSNVLRGYQARVMPRDDNFGIALYTRLPADSLETVEIGEAGVPSIRALIRTPHGDCTILATHPLPPAGAEYSRLRNGQLEGLARVARGVKGPLLLVGDLNVTPWNHYFKKLVRESGLSDSARGRGIQPSWPVQNPLLRIPLDHALHTPDIGIASRRIGPAAGSDHFPVIVEFVVGAG